MSYVISHVGLGVIDIERSQRFYIEVLGFEYDRTLELPAAAVSPFLKLDPPAAIKAVYLLRGAFQLELMQFDPVGRKAAGNRTMIETGLTHLSVCVDDLEAVTAKALAHGGSVMSKLGDRAVFLRDPDGQLIELITMDNLRRVEADRAARRRKD